MPKVELDGGYGKLNHIRRLLEEGRVRVANKFLVILMPDRYGAPGYRLGRKMGTPTANMRLRRASWFRLTAFTLQG
jgi:FAD synthase